MSIEDQSPLIVLMESQPKTVTAEVAAFIKGDQGVPGPDSQVNNIAALRALDTTVFSHATTLGYSSAGDGGGSSYNFVQTDILPTDTFMTIRSNDGRGYWDLSHNGVIDIKQTGARAEIDCSSQLRAAVAAANASNGAINRIVMSAISGDWTISDQVLLNLSAYTLELRANIRNTSTIYRTPLVFAHDLNAQPLAALYNVRIVANGFRIDQNGGAIKALMALPDGQLPPTFPSPMFNYIDNLEVHQLDAFNGVYDSLNHRQCRNHKFYHCHFHGATQYLANGYNATTNWAPYVRGDIRTYAYGVTEDCFFYNNASMGGTYYHAAGGVFRRAVAIYNGLMNGPGGSGSGLSYESVPGSAQDEYADGLFDGVICNFNGINGIYINTPGVKVLPNCSTMGNGVLGIANDVSGLQMNGVMVVGVDDVDVDGAHTFNARHGVSFLGKPGLKPKWDCGGEYSDNVGCGIAMQSIYRGGVRPGTKLFRNGRTQILGQNLVALSVSNSAYLNGQGSFTATGLEFDSNGARDVNIANVRTVELSSSKSFNPNDVRGTTGGTGMNFGAITTLILHDNFLDVTGNGFTSNGYVINNDVSVCYQKSNKSNQLTGTVLINNASTKFGISGAVRMNTGTHATLTTLPPTASATLANLADFVATLNEALKDGIMQA